VLYSAIQDKEAVKELFGTVAEKVGGRPGGYTRIIKLRFRAGDNADTAMIELVDFNEIYGKGKGEEKAAAKKTRRSSGSRKKAVAPAAAPAATEAPIEEAPAAE